MTSCVRVLTAPGILGSAPASSAGDTLIAESAGIAPASPDRTTAAVPPPRRPVADARSGTLGDIRGPRRMHREPNCRRHTSPLAPQLKVGLLRESLHSNLAACL